MNYKRKEINNAVLHTINTDVFKTITIDIYFRREVKKEDLLTSYFMLRLLEYSTKKYDYKSLIEKKEDLFNVKIYTDTEIESEKFRNDSLKIKFIHPKYSYDNIEKEVIELIKEIILNPNFDNREYYQEIETQIENEILSLKNDRRTYAFQKMLENIEDSSIFSYPKTGRLEDLKNNNIDKIKANYEDLINNSQIDIVIVGELDNNKYEDYFSNIFNSKRYEQITYSKYDTPNKEKEVFIEEKELNQNKLCIGLRILNFDYKKEEYILSLYRTILGSGTNSKLFVEVREKNSLTYYTSAKSITPSLMGLEFGIDKNNYKKAVDIIKQTLLYMKSITEEDLEIAKKNLISNCKDIEFNSRLISKNYYKKEINKDYTEDISTMIEKINSVTVNEIIEFANKVYIDTILLYGENYEKDKNK